MNSRNLTIQEMRGVYTNLNHTLGLVASEVTFTVDPSKVSDVNKIKMTFMRKVESRIKACLGLKAFIITREDHENGFPHAHGIVWFDSRQNNAPTLCCGNPNIRVRRRLRWEGDEEDRPLRHIDFSPLGRGYVKLLRTTPYTVNGKDWDDWLDYICKDQGISWTTKNIVYVE